MNKINLINVWTNGCFDVIHRGHVEILKHAKSLGDHLTVGIDTDRRVKSLKGNKRPFHCLEDRVSVLSSIKYVDKVVIFDSDEELENLIKECSPKFFVKGDEYKGGKIIGIEYAENLSLFSMVEGHSTTGILNKYNEK